MSDGARRGGVVVRWSRAAGMSVAVVAALSVMAGGAAGQTTDRVAPAEPGVTDPQPPVRGSRYSRQAEQEITFQEGLLHYSNRQLDLAERDFRTVIAEDPTDAEAHYYLGLTQLDSGRPAEAVESFNQSLRLDPTSDEVRAARAAAFIKVGRYEEAKQDLASLETDPRWASNVAYLRGQMLYAQGDFRGASGYFRRARALGGTEAAPAEFYEGLTYLQMQEHVRARAAFREAGRGTDRDPTLNAASRQIDEVLARQQQGGQAKPWDVNLYVGYEYDTNVLVTGESLLLPDLSESSDGRLVVQPSGSYRLIDEGPLQLGVEATGFFTFQDELTDFNYTSYQAGPFLTYRVTDNLYASARYGFNYFEVGHDPFLERHVITAPQVTWMQPKFGFTSVYYQLQLREFTSVRTLFVREGDASGPLIDPYDFDGSLHGAGVVQGITLPEIFAGAGPSNLEINYRFDRNFADGTDFDSTGHTVSLAFYTPLPLWKLRADVGASVRYDTFDNPNSADNDPFFLEPEDEEREDLLVSGSAGLTKEITDFASVRVDYTYTNNDSNVEQDNGSEPYTYDRHVVGVRLILSY